MLHPIENIIQSTMEQIKQMVDVNTIVGDPVLALPDTTIVPVSKVSLGFCTGGGEYNCKGTINRSGETDEDRHYPFAGNTLAGFSITPMAFLAVTGERVSLLPVQYNSTIDRVIELVPRVITEVNNIVKSQTNENEQKTLTEKGS